MGQKNSKGTKSKKGSVQLSALTVADILPKNHKQVIALKSNTQILDALKTLAKNGILSAPVVSEEDSSLLGFLDVLDIVTFLSMTNKAAGNEYGDVVHMNVTCQNLIDFSRRNPLRVVTRATSLSEVVKEMAQNKVHRVAVVEDDGSLTSVPSKSLEIHKAIISTLDSSASLATSSSETAAPVYKTQNLQIITQSDLLATMGSYMGENLSSKKLDATIESLGIGRCHVECCTFDDLTAEAFLRMHEKGYSALGVVDGFGRLVNFLSGSHVRGLTENNLSDLMLSVGDFLMKHEEKRFKVFSTDVQLRDVIESVIESRFHRIFLVSDDLKPIGLLSLTDFINQLAYNLKVFDFGDGQAKLKKEKSVERIKK